MVSTLHVPHRLSLVVIFFVSLCFCRGASAAQILPSDLHGDCVPFLPYLEYTLDEKGSLDIEALALQEKSLVFQPIRSLGFVSETGTYWLRFTIGALAEGAKPTEWLLSLGESLPGHPKLYIPEVQSQTGMQQWRIVQVTDRHILNLPEAGSEAKTCFIRLDGPPGLWFAPMLRSPNNAANNWGALAKPAAVLSLAVLLILSLLRCFSERGQWRLWSVLFVGCSLAAGYLGLPTMEKGHIGFGQFASVLAPGLALMLLPHVARHMMRTQYFSRIIDAQLIVLTLVGACVTLLPLVPGFSWTARFLELWPLATIFFIPTALWALFLGIPASGSFLLICLLPPLFTAAGLLGLLSGLSADLLAAFPLYGITCSVLFLVASRSPSLSESKQEKPGKENEAIMLKDQLDDPNLRIIALDTPKPVEEKPQNVPTTGSATDDAKVSAELLENLQQPVDLLISEATHLEECALPPAVRVHAKNMVAHAKRLWSLVKGHGDHGSSPALEESSSCDLQIMMRDIYNHAMHVTNSQEIALGWYMPPEMPSLFQGKIRKLKQTLEMLVESSVRATAHGSVHFTVCPFPDDEDKGHLLFSVTDTGSGMPPKDRSGLAFNMAWELAADLHGALTLQSSVQGTTINLAVHLTNLEEKTAQLCQSPLVLICSQHKDMCQQLLGILQGMPCRSKTCASLEEALALCSEDPFALLIAHAETATAKSSTTITKIRKQNLEAGLPFCKVLAITRDDLSWKELGEAGYTFALLEPLDEEALRVTVSEVLEDLNKESSKVGAENSSGVQRNVPDLFGSGNAVPKDIQELTGLAKLIHTFSSLGNENTNTGKASDYTSQTAVNDANDLLSPSSAPLSFESSSPSQEKTPPLGNQLKQETSHQDSMPAARKKDASAAEDLVLTFSPSAPVAESSKEQESKHLEHDVKDRLRQSEDTLSQSQMPESNTSKNEAAAESQEIQSNASNISTNLHDDVSAREYLPKEASSTSELQYLSEISLPNAEGVAPHTLQIPTQKTALSFQDVIHPEQNDVQAQTGLKLASDEWVGEPVPVQKPAQSVANTPQEPNHPEQTPTQPSHNTWLASDEWVGEPVPVQKPAQSVTNASQEAHPEQTPTQPSHNTWLASDEWVGEPVPVQKPAQSVTNTPQEAHPEQTPTQPSHNTWLASDEWVGEPVPVQKATAPEIHMKRQTEELSSHKDDHSVPHKGNWSAAWEEETIPVLAEVEKEDQKVAEEKDSSETTSKSNVLDFIEDAVETNDINGTFVSLTEQKTDNSPKNGIAPDPALLDLVRRLNLAVEDAKRALAASQSMRVAEAAGRIAAECDAFSFRILARIARCVEQAGKAKDLNALKDLLPELAQQVERNNIALTQIR